MIGPRSDNLKYYFNNCWEYLINDHPYHSIPGSILVLDTILTIWGINNGVAE